MDSTNSSTPVDLMATDTEGEKSFDKGTWQEALQRSANLLDRSTKARKQASSLLWTGAQTAIEEWLPGADTDVSGENLYNEVLDILGKPRKGDASKVRTVAVAVKDHGLVLTIHPNLSKAYAEAVRLTKTKQVHEDEDTAADKAIEALAENIPHSTTTVEGAALILLSKGIDGAVVAILDALGHGNEAAHRSFMRAVSTEIAARVQAAKPKPAPKAPATAKGSAKPATGSSPKAAVKTAGTKAKPAKGTKAKPVPVSSSKGDPNKRALPAKAKPVQPATADKGAPISEPVEAGHEAVDTPTVPVKQAATKAKPVVVKR
jgi:hypothetical protein